MNTKLLEVPSLTAFGGRPDVRARCAAVLLALGATLHPVPADTLTWMAVPDPSSDARWSSPANWDKGRKPASGDALIFPAGNFLRETINDLSPAPTLLSIDFQDGGYVVSDEQVLVSGSLSSTIAGNVSDNRIAVDLTLVTADAASVVPVKVQAGRLSLDGKVQSPGGLLKTGAGTLRLGGASGNNFSGHTKVQAGVLELNKSAGVRAVGNPATVTRLEIGSSSLASASATVRYLAPNQIPIDVPIALFARGLLDLNNTISAVGDLSLSGGGISSLAGSRVQTGTTGLLQLSGDVTASGGVNAPRIIGNLRLVGSRTFAVNDAASPGADPVDLHLDASVSGSGALFKSGNGGMELTGIDTFTGGVTVNAGRLLIGRSEALPAFGQTTVFGTLELENGVTVTDQLLILYSGTLYAGAAQLVSGGTTPTAWNGAVQLRMRSSSGPLGSLPVPGPAPEISVAANGVLTLSGAIGGAAGFIKKGAGTLSLTGATANTYAGETVVAEGTLSAAKTVSHAAIPGNLAVTNRSAGPEAVVVRTEGTMEQINSAANVRLEDAALFLLANPAEEIRSLTGTGLVDLRNHQLTVRLENADDESLYAGKLRGTNSVLIKSGSGTLALTGDNTAFTGATSVRAGVLLINGTQPNSPVTVENSARLGGIGHAGALTIHAGGTLDPGTAWHAPGRLTAQSVQLDSGATFHADLLQPGAGSGHDQLVLTTTANSVANSALALYLGPALVKADQFVIVMTPAPSFGAADVFQGKANNSTFAITPLTFHITYGANIILDVKDVPASIASATLTGHDLDQDQLLDLNECNGLLVKVKNSSTSVLQDVIATLTTTTPGVIVTQPTSSYGDIPAGDSRENRTPFQFYTAPAYHCGEPIQFTLSIQPRDGQSFAIRFIYGGPRPPYLFNANPCEDSSGERLCRFAWNGQVNTDTLDIKGVCGKIKRISLSGRITVGTAGSLGRTPVEHGGGEVTLHSPLGIPAGIGYAFPSGGFLLDSDWPGSPLAALVGREGADLNGTWRLDFSNLSGPDTMAVLQNWTILIEAECCEGTGPCAMCPNKTLSGDVTRSPLTLPVNLAAPRTECGNTEPLVPTCTPVGTPLRYDAYLFVNTGPSNCFTVKLDAPCQLFSGAILHPSQARLEGCPSLLGSSGTPAEGHSSDTYSFSVPENSQFLVFVLEQPGASCGQYTLTVSGGSCQAALFTPIRLAHDLVLRWPTTAVGFQLESSSDLHHWIPVPTLPTIIRGQFMVTNATAQSQAVFRLRKP